MSRLAVAALLLAAVAAAGEPRADYQALLSKVVKSDGVDYTTLEKERKALDAYVATLAKASPGKKKLDRIAFWINAYNALTLQHVLDNKPDKGDFSVYHDVDEFWDKRQWTVAERKVSLNDIEHEILRKEFKEPRIHFALNCASRSCPPLAKLLYRGDTLDVVLTQQTRAFLADKTRNRFNIARRRAEISEIFRWYREDFERDGKGLQAYLAAHAPMEKLARELRGKKWHISFLRYNWGLNEAGKKHGSFGRLNPLWLILYGIATLGLLLYGFHAFKLLLWRRREGDRYRRELQEARATSRLGRTVFPKVCVQVPVFNEPGVVERAIDAVATLDYPKDVLDIQVLDDSTDLTVGLVERAVARWRGRGVPIRVLRRGHRAGFKAGALAAGLARSDAEYVLVIDADFVPPTDFLRRALPLFDAPGRVGCVQGRWGHLNRDQNWLTRAQAVGVDAHFHVVQFARAAAGRFLNFSGTAGIWRRRAIEEAGGWHGDTLTEDLDLSYRAQLRGWRIVLDPSLVAPAELPPTLAAFKSQQRRWACGSMQCARKLLGPVWRSDQSLATKIEATLHLCGYAVCLAMVTFVFFLPFGMWHGEVLTRLPQWWPLWAAVWVAGLGPLAVTVAGQRVRGRYRRRHVLSALVLVFGSSMNCAVAVLRGLFRPIPTFVRTPKQGALAARLESRAPKLEQAMAIVTLASVFFLARNEPWATVTYALFCSAGFCTLATYWWAVERRA